MCYPGHEGGKEEAEAVEAFLSLCPIIPGAPANTSS